MLKELIDEIQKKKEQEVEAAKAAMIKDMKSHTLRVNIEQVLLALAKVGLKAGLELMDEQMLPQERARKEGAIAILRLCCESIDIALKNSKDSE